MHNQNEAVVQSSCNVINYFTHVSRAPRDCLPACAARALSSEDSWDDRALSNVNFYLCDSELFDCFARTVLPVDTEAGSRHSATLLTYLLLFVIRCSILLLLPSTAWDHGLPVMSELSWLQCASCQVGVHFFRKENSEQSKLVNVNLGKLSR